MYRPLPRYLVWIAYDGSRFSEMAKGGTGFGVLDLFEQVVAANLFGPRSREQPAGSSSIRFSPSSRTDAHVHALRNSVILQVPHERANFDDSPTNKERVLNGWNTLSQTTVPGGLSFLDIHRVSPGFCIRRSVAYRKYTYRLAIRKSDLDDFLAVTPSIACFSERHYAWLLPSGFCTERATKACELFKGVHVMGSFMKHTAREKRLEPRPPDAIRNILQVCIYKGAPYAVDNDLYDYYNISVVARSFLREQIRRMVSCVVLHAYGVLPLHTIHWLLRNPCSSNFQDRKISVAPPEGLFLTDVVYNTDDFLNPSPYFSHSWDDEAD